MATGVVNLIQRQVLLPCHASGKPSVPVCNYDILYPPTPTPHLCHHSDTYSYICSFMTQYTSLLDSSSSHSYEATVGPTVASRCCSVRRKQCTSNSRPPDTSRKDYCNVSLMLTHCVVITVMSNCRH